MPCRKENYILLEQSVTVDSKEVDALVTKIGEALQLHNNSANQKAMACLHGNVKQTCGSKSGGHAAAQHHRRAGCCMRLRSRGQRSRSSPYNIPGSSDQEWDHVRTWNRKRTGITGDDDDPHRLLQELILSGNLIKEAVRRLQFSASERGDHSKAADGQQCL
ncbi:glycogen synthase kinase binding protein [Denticeps clupeoides]|uniref:GSK-3-binding protein n=1 Tax=Denticeps clupeoides TaxID=299321 RepID=A0AAY4BAY8_9TELE|nr:GSK-3-binding protein-like [Denticeps clupeoides]